MTVTNVFSILQSCSLSELLKISENLNSLILKARDDESNAILASKPEDYITDEGQYLNKSSFEYNELRGELEALGLNIKSAAEGPQTKWLTSTNQQYSWSASSGHVTVKHPMKIEDMPCIFRIMSNLNLAYDVDLNSCLVSYYKNGQAKMKYHDDSEETLDQSTPMFVISLGAERTVDFIHHGQDGRSKPVYSLTPSDGSLYIMQPGCQQNFQHRVRGNNKVYSERFSLSFRRMNTLTNESQIAGSGSPCISPSILPVASSGACVPRPNHVSTPTSAVMPPCGIVPSAPPEAALTDVSGHTAIPSQPPRGPKKRATSVIFGSSITKWIRGRNLGLQGRKVINMSKSGAKIRDITHGIREFYDSHEEAKADNIDKIIISVGTNDIKYSRRGVGHLRKYLTELISTSKALFPRAKIIFQCCLPIKIAYTYTVTNVLEFNRLLRALCSEFDCTYLDCFTDFLSDDKNDYNKAIYSDWLHLNGKGLSILSRWLKFVVNQNSFDRIVDFCPYFA